MPVTTPEKRIAGNRDAEAFPERLCSAVMIDSSCYSLPYDYSLCNALTRQGCEATLICSEFVHEAWKLQAQFRVRPDFYRATHAYARTHVRGTSWKVAKAVEHALDMRRLRSRLAKEWKPDVIHFQWMMLPFVDNTWLGSLRHVAPLVFTLHNTTIFHGAPASRLQALGYRSALKKFDAVIVHSEYSRQRATELGWIDAEKLRVIPHGSLDYYRCVAQRPESSQASESENRILFFGNLKEYKGVDLLIRAFAELPSSILGQTRLVIAGKPMMEVAPLKRLAQELRVNGRIDWQLGHVREKDVPALFRSASVVALPYREIDQSGVLMTAIAFEKPVVASRVGGIAETIHDGTHGYLVPAGDVPGLAAALASVLADPGRRGSMEAAVGQLRQGELCWDSIAKRTLALYRELAGA